MFIHNNRPGKRSLLSLNGFLRLIMTRCKIFAKNPRSTKV
ncbi:hypothetical protein FLA_0601 [Filimonas lacunae]|nr:hypothetical protein FLA_0601 [Filimonas lacunae]